MHRIRKINNVEGVKLDFWVIITAIFGFVYTLWNFLHRTVVQWLNDSGDEPELQIKERG